MTATTGRSKGAGIVEVAALRLDLAHALSIARAAIASAERSDCVISVAICNREGRIIAFLKMDGTGALSGHEAMRRAIAAAGLGRPSEMVLDNLTDHCSRVSTVENEGIGSSHQRGGLPLVHLGQEFGAVGVCGACDAETDVACARAATLAFQETPPVLWSTCHKPSTAPMPTSTGMSTGRQLRNQYVVAALKDRRSHLAGELRQLESQAKLKAEALAHLDAVLAMYAPEIDAKALPVRAHRPDHPWRVIGLSRRIRGVLRRRGEPMATAEVVDAIVAEMGFPAEAHRVVAHAVRYALRNLATTDPSVVKAGERAEARWSLA